jgi:hypothetical protein
MCRMLGRRWAECWGRVVGQSGGAEWWGRVVGQSGGAEWWGRVVGQPKDAGWAGALDAVLFILWQGPIGPAEPLPGP